MNHSPWYYAFASISPAGWTAQVIVRPGRRGSWRPRILLSSRLSQPEEPLGLIALFLDRIAERCMGFSAGEKVAVASFSLASRSVSSATV